MSRSAPIVSKDAAILPWAPWSLAARWALLGTFVAMSVIAATTFFIPFGIYLGQMVKALGWSRGEFSFGFSIASLCGAAMTPVSGWLVDRYGSRSIVTAGALLLPLAMACFGVFPASYSAFLAACVFMGVVSALSAPSVVLSIPPQWVERNLGFAFAIGGVGFGVGATVLPPLTAAVVGAVGWREAWLVMAGLVGIVGIGNALLLIRDNPDVMRARRARALSEDLPGFSFGETIRSVAYWLLIATYLIVAVVYTGVAFHIVPLLTDMGIPPAQAASALGIMGIASLLGRLGTGLWLDRMHVLVVGCSILGGLAAGLITLSFAGGGTAPYIAAALIGLAVGGEADLMPFILRRRFGQRAFGRTYGLAYGFFQLGPILGPLAMGIVFDRTHSYQQILYWFIAAVLTSIALLAFAVLLRDRTVPASVQPC